MKNWLRLIGVVTVFLTSIASPKAEAAFLQVEVVHDNSRRGGISHIVLEIGGKIFLISSEVSKKGGEYFFEDVSLSNDLPGFATGPLEKVDVKYTVVGEHEIPSYGVGHCISSIPPIADFGRQVFEFGGKQFSNYSVVNK